ncbi:hypothetical protein [Streptomyces sp. NPDC001205]
MTALDIVRRARHAGQTPAQLKDVIFQLEKDNATVTEANETLVCELTRAMIRACQDRMRIAQAEAERNAAVAEVKRLQAKVIRAGAEHARLRQAVITARPRFSVAVQQLDRPYVSNVQLPYQVPVGRSTSNETTQALPLIDLPQGAA